MNPKESVHACAGPPARPTRCRVARKGPSAGTSSNFAKRVESPARWIWCGSCCSWRALPSILADAISGRMILLIPSLPGRVPQVPLSAGLTLPPQDYWAHEALIRELFVRTYDLRVCGLPSYTVRVQTGTMDLQWRHRMKDSSIGVRDHAAGQKRGTGRTHG